MNRLDKLLQEVRGIDEPTGVHFILNGYCSQCGGVCAVSDMSDVDVITIINDIPRDYIFTPPDLSVYQAMTPVEAPTTHETKKVHEEPKEEKETPYSRLFGHG